MTILETYMLSAALTNKALYYHSFNGIPEALRNNANTDICLMDI
jgi:hypothetical protein